jgi:hypothetical protein
VSVDPHDRDDAAKGADQRTRAAHVADDDPLVVTLPFLGFAKRERIGDKVAAQPH